MTLNTVYLVTHVQKREVVISKVFADRNAALALWTELNNSKRPKDEVRVSVEKVDFTAASDELEASP